MTSEIELYYPKELSWLSFNQRVLQEAIDEKNPIIERIRFLGIYSNNMDEFYRVKVSDVKRQILLHRHQDNPEKAAQANTLMAQIQKRVLLMTTSFDRAYQKVVKGLARYNIFLLTHPSELNEYQRAWCEDFFKNKILRHIAPILLGKKVDLSVRLKDSVTYLFVALKLKGKNTRYACIEVPSEAMSRFVVIPPQKSRKKKYIILLDSIIEQCIDSIFRGFVEFDSLESYSFKMTRDADYSINDEIDESYVEKMSDSMKQRLVAEPTRLIYDNAMPEEMLTALTKMLKISQLDTVIAGGAFRNFKDFIGFPNIGRSYMENTTMPALESPQFSKFDTVFEAITHQDILLYYPYHRFLHFSEFVRQAALDPKVKHIRLNLYRLAKKSRIVESLIDAVDNGKAVTVIVELRARFDEEANIEWSKHMKKAGIRVQLGVPGLKIHSKLCLITREEKGKLINYAHIGTGNFNESTAKIYTDFSLFTRNQDITTEVQGVFDFIHMPYRKQIFQHLQVSPLNSRRKIQLLIRQETQNAKDGIKACITIKMNNLVDIVIIDELYKASQAGVNIRILVRGMCSLVPGIKGVSENISVISIVDRFLEHARVMIFENGGDETVIITSADLMGRNLDNRIEVGCPIYDTALAKQIKHIIELQFKDTLKARRIDAKQQNQYVKRGNRRLLRSQIEIYQYLKNLSV